MYFQLNVQKTMHISHYYIIQFEFFMMRHVYSIYLPVCIRIQYYFIMY